jgi:phenylalanyl-tRNA synthetase beta chain
MKFSERWLRTLVDPPLDSAGLCERLTMAGLEVESSEPAAPPFSDVVVARIETVDVHPNADRLRVCHVDIGGTERLRIVCGAPTAVAGMKVPCATVGGELPDEVRITAATMRGVVSRGMLCSSSELGIDADAAGLLALANDAPVGADVRDVLQLDDALITLKITPNRADCLSVLGIAREVAAVTGAPLAPPPAAPSPVTSRAVRAVRIEDAVACPRFVSRVIEAIDAGAQAPW